MDTKGKLPIVTGVCFLFVGIFLIWQSMLYESTILLFISLAVTFWGSLLLAVRSKDFTKSILVSVVATSPLETIDELLKTLKYTGKYVCFPPDLEDKKSGHIFVLNDGNYVYATNQLKSVDIFKKNNVPSIVPPGLELVNLFEMQLRKSFTKVSLDYIVSHLPKVILEDLELAKKCKITLESDLVHVQLDGIIFDSLCKKISETTSICNSIGCPFVSAIACALARSTCKPVVIVNSDFSKKSKSIQVTYKMLGA